MYFLRQYKSVMLSAVCAISLFHLPSCATAEDNDIDSSPYPFEAFLGEWTLKDDAFEQVWDGQTVDAITIPNHYTLCAPVNTEGSILCEVDASGFQGHILWVYDQMSGGVHHLSHFGTARLGVGEGQISDSGDLHTKVVFKDEPVGTYRRYAYTWITPDEYLMISTQYGADKKPTGNYYKGTFVRLQN